MRPRRHSSPLEAPPAPPDALDAQIERWLPTRYRGVRPIARGGQGRVIAVTDRLRPGEELAMKVVLAPPGNRLSRDLLSALRSEFDLLARLAHPSLARVRDFGALERGRGVFFTSELVRGPDLFSWCSLHRVSEGWDAVLALVTECLGALHAIHRSGYSHGDVKPANILVQRTRDTAAGPPTPDGGATWTARIVDLGGARLRRDLAGAPGSERPPLWSTPAYRCPPALEGDPVQEDLFGFGVTLVHALLGRLPFRLGDREDQSRWLRSGEPVGLERLVPGCPLRLARLVERLLTRGTGPTTAAARPSTALEALASLGQRRSRWRVRARPEGTGRLRGRERELSDLRALLRGSAEPCVPPHDSPPSPAVVVVAGPPGQGKSALGDALEVSLQLEGWTTVRVQPDRPGVGLGELHRMAHADEWPEGEGGAREPYPEERFARIFDRLRAGRVALLVDGWAPRDPGNAGEETLVRALRVLARRTDGERGPRCVVLTAHPEPLRAALGRSGLSRTSRLDLGPLPPSAVREIIADRFQTDQVPDDLVATLQRLSAGHPRSLVRLLNRLEARGVQIDALGLIELPEGWSARLESSDEGEEGQAGTADDLSRRLGEGARWLLDHWRLLHGLPLSATQARLLLAHLDGPLRGADGESWRRSIEELYWAGAVARHGSCDAATTFRPVGPRSCGRKAPPAAWFGSIGRRLSSLLDDPTGPIARGDPDVSSALLELAIEGSDIDLMLPAAIRLARQLRRRARHREALTALARVVEVDRSRLATAEPGVDRLRSRRVVALCLRGAQLGQLAGDTSRSVAFLDALDWTRAAISRTDRRYRLALLLRSEAERERGQTGRALRTLRALLETLGPVDRSQGSGAPGEARPPLWFLAHARLAGVHFERGEIGEGSAHLEPALALLEETDTRSAAEARGTRTVGLAEALAAFGRLHARHGDMRLARRLLERSRELARQIGRSDLEVAPLQQLAALHAEDRRFGDAEAAFRECQQLAERRDDRLGELQALVNRATLLYRAGRRSEARDLYVRAKGLSDSLGPNRCASTILVGLEVIARERGELLTALRLLRRILRGDAAAESTVRWNALFNLGEIYVALGRPDRALAVRREALALAESVSDQGRIARSHLGLARVHATLASASDVASHLESAEQLLDETEDRLRGWADTTRAILDRGAHTHEGDERALRSTGPALRRHRLHRNPEDYEITLLGLVDLLLRRGNRLRARRLLDSRRSPLRGQGASHVPGRLPRLRAAYDLASSEEATPRAQTYLSLLAEAEGAGHIWEALQIAGLAIRHGGLDLRSPDGRALETRFEELLGRFSRRLRTDTTGALRRALRGPSGAGGTPATDAAETSAPGTAGSHRPGVGVPANASPAATVPEELVCLAQEWSSLGPAQLQSPEALEHELDRVRRTLGARALWIINDPREHESVAHAAATCRDEPLDALTTHRDGLERCRRASAPQRLSGGWFLPLGPAVGSAGRPGGTRVLYVQTAAVDPRGEPLPEARLRLATAMVSLLLGLRDLGRSLERAKGHERDLAAELREIHERVLREKSQLETDVMSRRREAASIQRDLEGPGSPGPRSFDITEFTSPCMRRVIGRARQLAATRLPVLIVGEAGVGKDSLARLIHALGPRRDAPFIGQVCEIPPGLLEAELFGCVRGSFTGAERDREGLFRTCRGGTLYLDHIEDLSPEIQARLLRAVEDGTVRPVGSDTPVEIDVRILASSRLSLDRLLASPQIRQEFLMRLRGDVLEVPPLRERPEDIEPLFEHFLATACETVGAPRPRIDPGVDAVLRGMAWLGNLRELQNVAQRALLEHRSRLGVPQLRQILADMRVAPLAASPSPRDTAGDRISTSPEVAGSSQVRRSDARVGTLPTLREARLELEARLLRETLDRCGGNATQAARSLGVSRRHLGTLLARHGIDPRAHRPGGS